MKTIFVILILAVMFCLIAGFLTAVGFGIGFLITACTSSIEPGQAFIAGCIIATASTFFLLKLLRSVQRDMNDDEDIPDDHPVLVLPRDFISHLPGRSRSRKKQK